MKEKRNSPKSGAKTDNVTKSSALNNTEAKLQKITLRERVLDYFISRTETARSAAIDLGIFRDGFSPRLKEWVKEGLLKVAYTGRDKRTNRTAKFYTANPIFMELLEDRQPKQLSLFDLAGFEEKGGSL